jgi:hypothetical protein
VRKIKSLERWQQFSQNSNSDLDHDLDFDVESWNANSFEVLPYRTLVWSFVKFVRKIKSLERWQRFSKNSNSDLDLWRSIMKRELVRGLTIPNTFVWSFVKFVQKIKSLEQWQWFSKNSNSDHDLDLDAASWNANSFEVLPYRTLVYGFVKFVRKITSLERWQEKIISTYIHTYIHT